MRVRAYPTSYGFGAARGDTGSDGPTSDPLPSPPISTVPIYSTPIYSTPIPPPAPVPVSQPPRSLQQIIAEYANETRARLHAATTIVMLAVGPYPFSGNLSEILAWARRIKEKRESNPDVATAMDFIEQMFPPQPDGRGGLLGALAEVGEAAIKGVQIVGGAIVRGVSAVGHAIGSVISFVAGGFPSPADYEPENLCVTAWTDPAKFAVLSAVAAIIFPPALLYMGTYVPPSVLGLTAGLAQAMIKGGTERVIAKILNPLFDAVAELAGALLDYAFNGNAALVRWAIKKIAQRLPDSVVKGVLLALSTAADTIIDAIKSASRVTEEGFWDEIGKSVREAGAKFFGTNMELRTHLEWIGNAIAGGGAAVAILIDKQLGGVQEAFQTMAARVLGLGAEFDRLPERERAYIADAKAQVGSDGKSQLDVFHMLMANLKDGAASLADALKKLPFKIGDILGAIVGLLSAVLTKVEQFIDGLLALAGAWRDGMFNPAPPPMTTPLPPAQEIPTPIVDEPPTGSLFGKLLFVAAGGIAGALVGGPPGLVVGAAAGAVIPAKGG